MFFWMLMGPQHDRHAWNQGATDRALAGFREATDDRDVHAERLWWMIRDEVMTTLRAELRNDIAVDEAEFVALKEFRRRLESGNIRFLSRVYIRRFICGTAIRFVRKRQPFSVIVTPDDPPAPEIVDTRPNPAEKLGIKYADLYFCLQKLSAKERQLLQLHHYSNMGLEEAAKSLGIQHDAARQQHSRAVKKLRLCLEGLGAGGWS